MKGINCTTYTIHAQYPINSNTTWHVKKNEKVIDCSTVNSNQDNIFNLNNL